MPLQTSGQISLDDIHVEAGGTTGTAVSINDTDIRALISSTAGTAVDFADYYGASSSPAGWTTVDTISGQSASWSTRTPSTIQPANTGGRYVFVYQNGTAGTSYEGDIQLDDIRINGTTYSFESDAQDFQRAQSVSSWSTTDYDNQGFSDVTTATTSNYWNRDTGGTPSSNTGLTTADDGSYYLYAETSGTSSGWYYVLRSPWISGVASPSFEYAEARSGGNIGTLTVYFHEEDEPVVETETVSAYALNSNNAVVTGSSTTVTDLYFAYPTGTASGDTLRVFVWYKSGTSYTGDLQLDDVYYDATSSTAGGTNLNVDTAGEWQYGAINTRTSTFSPTALQIETIYGSESTWTDTFVTTGGGLWGIDSNGTGSSGTGLTAVGAGNYLYFETSSPGYSYKQRSLRSNTFTRGSSGGIRLKVGHYGATIGELKLYILKVT